MYIGYMYDTTINIEHNICMLNILCISQLHDNITQWWHRASVNITKTKWTIRTDLRTYVPEEVLMT